MAKHVNLLEGRIFSSLTRLALPIMATALINMAYNMVDMLWIGRAGAGPVAAVGAAGMYMWLSQGIAPGWERLTRLKYFGPHGRPSESSPQSGRR